MSAPDFLVHESADNVGVVVVETAEAPGAASEALILSVIEDSESKFATTPLSVRQYAEFLYRTGAIKAQADSWTDLFFPDIHVQPGS